MESHKGKNAVRPSVILLSNRTIRQSNSNGSDVDFQLGSVGTPERKRRQPSSSLLGDESIDQNNSRSYIITTNSARNFIDKVAVTTDRISNVAANGQPEPTSPKQGSGGQGSGSKGSSGGGRPQSRIIVSDSGNDRLRGSFLLRQNSKKFKNE